MSNPKPLVVPDFLKSLSNLKPAEAEDRQPGSRVESKSPMPKVKASTKPIRSTVTHARSTNRGK